MIWIAFRTILRRPIIPGAVVATIAIAMALNTALFSIVDGLLFRPLPYKEPDRIVHLEVDRSARLRLSRHDLQAVFDRGMSTTSLIERADVRPALLFDQTSAAVLNLGIRPYLLGPSAFDLLGVRPLLGRAFTELDTRDAPFAVLLGHDLWMSWLGGDPTVVGISIRIPGTAADARWRVVGIMPPEFSFPRGANFWVPTYDFYPKPALTPYARLSPGVTIGALRAELPDVSIAPLGDHLRPNGAVALGVLTIATALFVLIAWVQVSGLLLSQVAGRATEVGVRLALGASRGRLAAQFTVEAAILVLCSLLLSILATPSLTAIVVRALPIEITLGQTLVPDQRAFAVAAAISAVGLLVLTILPLDLLRRGSAASLLQGQIAGTIHIRASRFRTALVICQLAIVTPLVYLAALTLHSYTRLERAEPGFDPEGLVAVRMPRGDNIIASSGKAQLARQREMVAETVSALRALPAVEVVAGGHSWPFQPGGLRTESLVSRSDPSRSSIAGKYCAITLGYPDVLGIPLAAGTEPSLAELTAIGARMPPGEQVALANESLARRLERFGPPIGQVVGGNLRIVGVIPDVTLERADVPIEPTVFHYIPPPAAPAVLLVRVRLGRSIDDAGIASELGRIWGRGATRPVLVADAVRLATADHRARTALLAIIAGLTIPLAMLGTAGALTFSLRQRAREIAIQLALGAEPRRVRRRILRHMLTIAGAGVAAGLALGVGAGRFIRATLYGVGALDPVAVLTCVTLVAMVVLGSCLVPVHRACRMNPSELLREP
jgi:predicted permease